MTVLLYSGEELPGEIEISAATIYRLDKAGLTQVKNRHGALSRLNFGDLRCMAATLLADLSQEASLERRVSPARRQPHHGQRSHQSGGPKSANHKSGAHEKRAERDQRYRKVDQRRKRPAAATSRQPKGQRERSCKSNEKWAELFGNLFAKGE
jgi:hypothetical protein